MVACHALLEIVCACEYGAGGPRRNTCQTATDRHELSANCFAIRIERTANTTCMPWVCTCWSWRCLVPMRHSEQVPATSCHQTPLMRVANHCAICIKQLSLCALNEQRKVSYTHETPRRAAAKTNAARHPRRPGIVAVQSHFLRLLCPQICWYLRAQGRDRRSTPALADVGGGGGMWRCGRWVCFLRAAVRGLWPSSHRSSTMRCRLLCVQPHPCRPKPAAQHAQRAASGG